MWITFYHTGSRQQWRSHLCPHIMLCPLARPLPRIMRPRSRMDPRPRLCGWVDAKVEHLYTTTFVTKVTLNRPSVSVLDRIGSSSPKLSQFIKNIQRWICQITGQCRRWGPCARDPDLLLPPNPPTSLHLPNSRA